jgi:hypothetical protein
MSSKKINIYLQGLPKINHLKLLTFSLHVQGPTVLRALHVGLEPVSSFLCRPTGALIFAYFNYVRRIAAPTAHVSLKKLWL